MAYVLQFLLLALITRPGFLARLAGNTLYFVGVNLYMYHTFLGYQALPFISKAVVFVYPVGIATIIYLVSLFTFNFAQLVLSLYFE
jgi:hypothetical protein